MRATARGHIEQLAESGQERRLFKSFYQNKI